MPISLLEIGIDSRTMVSTNGQSSGDPFIIVGQIVSEDPQIIVFITVYTWDGNKSILMAANVFMRSIRCPNQSRLPTQKVSEDTWVSRQAVYALGR